MASNRQSTPSLGQRILPLRRRIQSNVGFSHSKFNISINNRYSIVFYRNISAFMPVPGGGNASTGFPPYPTAAQYGPGSNVYPPYPPAGAAGLPYPAYGQYPGGTSNYSSGVYPGTYPTPYPPAQPVYIVPSQLSIFLR